MRFFHIHGFNQPRPMQYCSISHRQICIYMDPCSSNSCCSVVICSCKKKKKKTLESLPTIGFLTVPYDPILGMFGHSNLIIWVLPIYLYIITFFLATIIQVLYSIKSGNTNLFGSLSPAVNMNDMPLAKEDQKATHALNILHSPKREGHTSS